MQLFELQLFAPFNYKSGKLVLCQNFNWYETTSILKGVNNSIML